MVEMPFESFLLWLFTSPLRGGLFVCLVLLGCRGTLSPLSNKLEVGQEPYIVFVADGEDELGDLFASPPTGGAAYQITFTRLDERAPALSSNGTMVAFLRSRAPGDSGAPVVVILNLLNGAERQLDPGARVARVAWNADGSALFLQTANGLRRVAPPPGDVIIGKVEAGEAGQADSAFKVLLGDPPIGEALPCAAGGVCAVLAGGTTVLSPSAHDAARWGSDSVLYVEPEGLVVRPLGGGGTRVIRFTGAMHNPRGVTRFGGGVK